MLFFSVVRPREPSETSRAQWKLRIAGWLRHLESVPVAGDGLGRAALNGRGIAVGPGVHGAEADVRHILEAEGWAGEGCFFMI